MASKEILHSSAPWRPARIGACAALSPTIYCRRRSGAGEGIERAQRYLSSVALPTEFFPHPCIPFFWLFRKPRTHTPFSS